MHTPFTPTQRKRIAEYLYGEREWTMARIAKAFGVVQPTISNDLAGLSTTDKINQSHKRGRPKGSGRKPKPEQPVSQPTSPLPVERAPVPSPPPWSQAQSCC